MRGFTRIGLRGDSRNSIKALRHEKEPSWMPCSLGGATADVSISVPGSVCLSLFFLKHTNAPTYEYIHHRESQSLPVNIKGYSYKKKKEEEENIVFLTELKHNR